jgi:hypothetical protein
MGRASPVAAHRTAHVGIDNSPVMRGSQLRVGGQLERFDRLRHGYRCSATATVSARGTRNGSHCISGGSASTRSSVRRRHRAGPAGGSRGPAWTRRIARSMGARRGSPSGGALWNETVLLLSSQRPTDPSLVNISAIGDESLSLHARRPFAGCPRWACPRPTNETAPTASSGSPPLPPGAAAPDDPGSASFSTGGCAGSAASTAPPGRRASRARAPAWLVFPGPIPAVPRLPGALAGYVLARLGRPGNLRHTRRETRIRRPRRCRPRHRRFSFPLPPFRGHVRVPSSLVDRLRAVHARSWTAVPGGGAGARRGADPDRLGRRGIAPSPVDDDHLVLLGRRRDSGVELGVHRG